MFFLEHLDAQPVSRRKRNGHLSCETPAEAKDVSTRNSSVQKSRPVNVLLFLDHLQLNRKTVFTVPPGSLEPLIYPTLLSLNFYYQDFLVSDSKACR